MAIGVARHINHFGCESAKRGSVAMLHFCVERRDLGDFSGANNDAAGRFLDRFIATCMIRVPMGVPDVRDRPAFGLRLLQIDIGIGRIDAGGLARCRIVDEIAIIVVETFELVDL